MALDFGAAQIPLGPIEAQVRKLLFKSVKRAPLESLDAVIFDIETGHALLWLISNNAKLVGLCVTRVDEGNGVRECHIWHCAGFGIRSWLHFLSIIEQWAKADLCDSITLNGRPGWMRLLACLGWKLDTVVLRKALA